jgi:hypothetical protein
VPSGQASTTTDRPLRRSPDGVALVPPGDGRAFVATAQDARVAVLQHAGDRAPDGAQLVVLDPDATAAAAASGGERAVRRALRAVRRAHPGALVAAPLQDDAPFDTRPSDVVLVAAPADPTAQPAGVLGPALRAGGRPLLVDVTTTGLAADALVAAFDLGAAGALVRTGDAQADERLAREAEAADAARLDDAPLASVVVCNHNGAKYLPRCFEALTTLAYPNYEVLLCDDGSTDDSVEIGRRHGVRVLELDKVGLSAARNAGLHAAEGEFVAYIDGDTEAEPHWLARIWRLMDRLGIEATGGPNLPFPDAGWQERAISGAPGGSTPVVDPDGSAVLLAGCNMAFRRDAALAVGGFDAGFPGAYDDVVFCLRLADQGARLVFAPAATIFHHRRDSITGFVRQQHGWGKGTVKYEAEHAGREHAGGEIVSSGMGRGLRDTFRGPVFAGPQGHGLWILTNAQQHTGLPLKLLAALTAGAAATAPVALVTGKLKPWAGGAAAALTALAAVTTAKAPVFAPPGRRAGLPLRAATAALWFAQPAARRLGAVRGRRAAR